MSHPGWPVRQLAVSSIFKNWSGTISFSTRRIPLGQRVSIEPILVSSANPKCKRLSLDDMKPTPMATRLYNTRPGAVAALTFAPAPPCFCDRSNSASATIAAIRVVHRNSRLALIRHSSWQQALRAMTGLGAVRTGGEEKPPRLKKPAATTPVFQPAAPPGPNHGSANTPRLGCATLQRWCSGSCAPPTPCPALR